MSAKASSSFTLIPDDYFVVKKSGLSQFQAMSAYLGGSAFQTIMDNPVTAYRQLGECGIRNQFVLMRATL
jgi:hypothetical protein